MKLVIKSISLEGHQIPVPSGLSELLSARNAWSHDHSEVNPMYERKVIKSNDGGLITYLRKEGN